LRGNTVDLIVIDNFRKIVEAISNSEIPVPDEPEEKGLIEPDIIIIERLGVGGK
jgi:hypothetical protein